VGCLTFGPLFDTLGRKRGLAVINTPFIVGWLLMWMAPKPAPVTLLYFARLLNGLGSGMVRATFRPSFLNYRSLHLFLFIPSLEPG
jgi:MFS family permease